MKQRIQALLDNGISIGQINREIVRLGSNYTGLYEWMKGNTNSPSKVNYDFVKRAVEIIEGKDAS